MAKVAPVTKHQREQVEAIIANLIDLLDVLDGDPDVEQENEHGGDIQDEPHDCAGAFDDIIADQDAADLLHEDLAFARWWERVRSANERRLGHH